MRLFRKHLALIGFLVLPVFFSILALEAAHHHNDNLESHDDCSICAWQVTGSQAPSTPVPPALVHFVAFFFALVFVLSFVPAVVSFPTSGRDPPSILL